MDKERGLNTAQLEHILKNPLFKKYVGEVHVVAASELKDLKIKNYPCLIIQNTSDGAGEHWICYFLHNQW